MSALRLLFACCLAAALTATTVIAEPDTGLASARAGTGNQTWLVRNNTTDPIWGKWEVQQGDNTSYLEWTAQAPLLPGTDASTVQHNPAIWNFQYPYWMGHFCFRGTVRGFERREAETLVFLVGNNGDELYVVYQTSAGVQTVVLGDTKKPC